MTTTNIQDDENILIERRPVDPTRRLTLLSQIYVERGTKADWDLLHELHYKAENLGIGPRVYRAVLNGQVIGVGVMTVPKMLLAGRNRALRYMRPNVNGRDTKLVNRHRAMWLNANTCTNSRLVLDTMFRGVGIAYRMQNLMMRMTGCELIEFQSSMSKFNPFAERAGIRITQPSRSSYYAKGLKFFKRWFEGDPADFIGLMDELNKMPAAVRSRCIQETREFYFKCSSMEKSGDNRANGTSRVDSMAVPVLFKSLQQLVLASPLYGLYTNPDRLSSETPPRLPLLAFDNQALDQRLDVSKALLQLAEINIKTDLIPQDWEDDANWEKEQDAPNLQAN